MPADKIMALLAVIIGLPLIVALPSIIAYARRHPDRAALARVNPLALFSFILWGALMVWAVGGKRNDSVISKFINNDGNRRLLIAAVVVMVGGGIAATAYAFSQM